MRATSRWRLWRAEADAWSREADSRYRACAYLRPLPVSTLPIAIGVKDTVDVDGLPTAYGLRRYRHHASRSAAVLSRLAGAAVNAKVVTTELNLGLGSGCGNPYFPDVDPAGSSTGSAVAVAAGICDLGLGTDVLGSVRWPAGRCGLVGLRTTHDPAALAGILPLSASMDAVGWVTRTADDLAVLWNRLGLGVGRVADAPRRPCRIGIITEATATGVQPEVVAALERAADALAATGHQLSAVSVAGPWRWRGAAWELCARNAWDRLPDWRRWVDEQLSASTQAALDAGARVSDRRLAELLVRPVGATRGCRSTVRGAAGRCLAAAAGPGGARTPHRTEGRHLDHSRSQ